MSDSRFADSVALAEEVVAEYYPAEHGLFDEVRSEFERDASLLLGSKDLRAPVGMGVELTLMTPYVLAAATFLGGYAAEKALDAVGRRVARAWAERRGDFLEPADGESPDEEVVVAVTVHLSGRGLDPEIASEIAAQVTQALLDEESL